MRFISSEARAIFERRSEFIGGAAWSQVTMRKRRSMALFFGATLVIALGRLIVRNAVHPEVGIEISGRETSAHEAHDDRNQPVAVQSREQIYHSSVPSEGKSISIAQLKDVQTGNATIAGLVLDSLDRPVAQVTVQVQIEDGGPVGPVLSDADGAFSVGNLDPSDRLFLSASKDDLRSERLGPLVLPVQGLSDIRITLESTGSISGRVVDEAGEAVPGAGVGAALSINEGRGTFERTDEAGRFRLQHLLRGHYVLRLVRPGAGLGSTVSCGDVHLSPGEHVTDLVLVLKRPEGLTIAGRVTDHSGKPVEDATVDAMRPSMIETTKTDAQGFYTVIGLDDVFYNVIASHKQFGRQLRDSVPAGSMGVDLVLPGVCDITGTVVDAATGAAVTEFEVALDYYAAAGVDPRTHRGYRTVQDPEGRFAFEGVDVGQPTLVVRAPSYAPHIEALKPIGPGETVSDIIVRLEAGRSVDGVVVDATGRPLRGVAIFVGRLPAESARERSVGSGRNVSYRRPHGRGKLTHGLFAPVLAGHRWVVACDHAAGSDCAGSRRNRRGIRHGRRRAHRGRETDLYTGRRRAK